MHASERSARLAELAGEIDRLHAALLEESRAAHELGGEENLRSEAQAFITQTRLHAALRRYFDLSRDMFAPRGACGPQGEVTCGG